MAYPGFPLGSVVDLEFGSKSLMKRHMEMKVRRIVGLRRVCYGLVLLAFAAIFIVTGFHPVHEILPSSNRSVFSLPTGVYLPSSWQKETTSNLASTLVHEMHIQDVLSFDSVEVLVLVRVPESLQFPSKERMECRYGSEPRVVYTKALALHMIHKDMVALLCGGPPKNLQWEVRNFLIEIDQVHHIRKGPLVPEYRRPLMWNATTLVVYEAFATGKDVVLFVHGTESSRGLNLTAKAEQERLKHYQCVYDGHFEMAVTAQAQEVFRCGHPPELMISSLVGKKVTVRFDGKLLPSVAYYNPPEHLIAYSPTSGKPLLVTTSTSTLKPHHVCACTMVYNGAKFLKEWVYYHSHLGVEKYFLYDNNSEDDLDDVVSSLARFNVTKHPWPWVKTQEAGFSHCTLLAHPECTWMLFVDVDEYFFPNKHFLSPKKHSRSRKSAAKPESSILGSFITEAMGTVTGKLGQIFTFCLNYGPSGLTTSPPQGVTQGYTCRVQKPERHKSVVLLDAVADSLANVIHHFSLEADYQTKKITPGVAVINHYKFQVWDEFKVKFHRRAATYVADWTENRNHGSKDRVPHLGTKALKPPDWESRYCEVHDYGIRNYTRAVFGSKTKDSFRLAWE